MSVEDKVMGQHIVPREHLRRFTGQDGFLFVHRLDGGEIHPPFKKSPDNVCKEDNYYDEDPYREGSIEHGLKIVEDRGQKAIDEVLLDRGGIPERRDIIGYVSMLVGRSKEISESYRRRNQADLWDAKDDDELIMRQVSVLESFDTLFLHRLDEFRTLELRNSGAIPFITGDVPYAIVRLDPERSERESDILRHMIETESFHFGDSEKIESNNRLVEMMADATRGFAVLCPLSPSLCTIVYHDSVKDIHERITALLGNNPVWFVNGMILHSCISEVYSDIPMEGYVERLWMQTASKWKTIDHEPKTDSQTRIGDARSETRVDNIVRTTEDEDMKSKRDEKHPRNQIERMFVELRFAPIPAMESEYLEFRRRFTEDYPIYRTTILQPGLPDIPPTQGHEFLTNDGFWRISVSNSSLTLFTNSSEGWPDFRKRLKEVVDAFNETLGTSKYARVGYRVVFAMRPSSIDGVDVATSVLKKPYRDVFQQKLGDITSTQCIQKIKFADKTEGTLGITNITFSDKEPGIMIDIDTSVMQGTPPDELFDVLDVLSGYSDNIFRSVTDEVVHKLPQMGR